MLSLEEEDGGAIATKGAVEIFAEGCGVAVNSSADDALTLNGSVDINVGDISIVGGYDVKGGSADFNYKSLKTGQGKTKDPYADLENDEESNCSKKEAKQPVKVTGKNQTLTPGVYCGGLSISASGTTEFEPGVYIIDGGDFDVSGSGELFGEGVTFILTNSGNGDYGNLQISGSSEINFTAPEEGEPWEGIVFYQDAPPDDGHGNTHPLFA
jgi:hypothetical protein